MSELFSEVDAWISALIVLVCFGLAALRLSEKTCAFIRDLRTWLAGIVATCITMLLSVFSVIGLIKFLLLRGRLTVRASAYMLALSQQNATPELANKLAMSIDTYAARQLQSETSFHLNEFYNGNRVALISAARLHGFNG